MRSEVGGSGKTAESDSSRAAEDKIAAAPVVAGVFGVFGVLGFL